MNNHSSLIKINTNNILKNYKFFKKRKKNLIVAPTIKADAYGLGVKKIFHILSNKAECKHFFVATLEEGIEINNKNKNISIYVLNGIQNYDLNLFVKNNLIPVINSHIELKRIIKSQVKFGLHIDTGINRLGLNNLTIPNDIYKSKNLSMVISHLSSADEFNNNYNDLQNIKFLHFIEKFKNKKIIFSLANSSGSVLSKLHLYDMVRPGIGLYGGNNNNKLLIKKIKPVITLSGKVIQVKSINKNEFIGYNQTFKTQKKIKVAIVGIGYADGIPRSLSNKGKVYYKNEVFHIIGRISMDSLTIDISSSKKNIKIGTMIDFINHKYNVESFANQCNKLSNEVMTSIGKRVKRIYV